MTFDRSGPPIARVRLVAVMPPCAECREPKEPERRHERLCADCEFERRKAFQRHRYLIGELTEWPEGDKPKDAIG